MGEEVWRKEKYHGKSERGRSTGIMGEERRYY
jgi:hypothetical protein